MGKTLTHWWLLFTLLVPAALASGPAQDIGSIRGVVVDADLEVPLAGVEVQLVTVDITLTAQTDEQGAYQLPSVPVGAYTVVFSRAGYQRAVKTRVVVLAGQPTDLDAQLDGEYIEMEGIVVRDMLSGVPGSEAAVLELRFDSASFLSGISSELMSKAGSSNAADGIRLVAGASLKDGKSAVIRGLPDRYVSSQLNGVRLPSSDDDKRAVDLDLFPSAVIDIVNVSKTFTPDQQGDASGGAVDVRLKGKPADGTFGISIQSGHNTQVTNNSSFRSYDGGGLEFWGMDDGGRDIQFENEGGDWDGAVGSRTANAPLDSKFQLSFGDQLEYEPGIEIGGFVSFFYERDSSHRDDEQDNSLWVESPGAGFTPEVKQGETGGDPQTGDFTTALFDITRSSQSVEWGGLLTMGVEATNHSVNLTYLHTHVAEDETVLAENTRGREFYFPGYDVNDPMAPGNLSGTTDASPYLRSQTLEYTERSAGSLQLTGEHTIDLGREGTGESFRFLNPEISWTLADSFSKTDQPDKRQFAVKWIPRSFQPAIPPFIPASINDPFYRPLNPAANVNLGNFQRIWREIEEDSEQYLFDFEFPFEQWDGAEGYLKIGIFEDKVDRRFDQNTYSNFGDSGSSDTLEFNEFWSDIFPNEPHPIFESDTDVDYQGTQDISAWYGMVDVPINERTSVIGGVRFEDTSITTLNDPESLAVWFPDGAVTPVTLGEGQGNVDFSQDDALPAISLTHDLTDEITLRFSYTETIARQTFKELTPIVQQEFLGGPIFIGRPGLRASNLENLDFRFDYQPEEGSLISVSYFEKKIEDPIEYVQTAGTFTYTTPINYPEGELSGVELEVRQDLGTFTDAFEGFSVGANATWIDSQVRLTDGEIAGFENIGFPISEREMVEAPENLVNLFLTYDSDDGATQFGLFYTLQGDTLVAGAGINEGNFIPSIYAAEFDTLNLTISQKLSGPWKLKFQAKNLTNPLIEEVYRSDYTGPDETQSSFTRGIDYSLTLSASLSF